MKTSIQPNIHKLTKTRFNTRVATIAGIGMLALGTACFVSPEQDGFLQTLGELLQKAQVAELDQLAADFHGALSYGGNITNMMSLWADQIQAKRTFDRRTGELSGSLSGSARFILLPVHNGKPIAYTNSQSTGSIVRMKPRSPGRRWRYSNPAILLAVLVIFADLRCSFADGVDDYVNRQMRRQHVAGLSMAVVKDGKLIKAKATVSPTWN